MVSHKQNGTRQVRVIEGSSMFSKLTGISQELSTLSENLHWSLDQSRTVILLEAEEEAEKLVADRGLGETMASGKAG